MHTTIFKLFPSVVNPVSWSTDQSFLRESTIFTHWILIKFMPNSVPEFTFMCSLFLPNFKATRLHIKSYSIFCKCAKRIM